MPNTTSPSRSWTSSTSSNAPSEPALPHLKNCLLLAILSCTAGCGAPDKGRPSPAAGISALRLPAQESRGVTVAVSDSGRQTALIRAGHVAEYHEGEKKELVIDGGITVTIHGRNGGAPTLMTAGRGLVHDNQDIEAFDQVVIHSGDGTTIRTGHIVRTSSDQMLRSEKFVTITKPSQTIRGYGFESDDAMKRYKIFKASGQAVSK
ncbi:MAG: LPS export ABC transporter periplasmic protein LptC [Chlorobiaceae bacterium]|nr:LPS export ABC transporter periplasmic protein LptC [Chlorobiaceae bacterium]